MKVTAPRAFLGLASLLCAAASIAADGDLGLFEAHGDVGAVGKPGAVVYDAKAGTYTVTGGGENMWFATDAFHFAWKKASGDVTLAADVRFVGTRRQRPPQGGAPDPPGPGAGRRLRGRGGARGRADVAPVPRGARGAHPRDPVEREGAAAAAHREGRATTCPSPSPPRASRSRSAGGSFRIRFAEPFLVGLGVCAHDDAVSETAVFSNVEITAGKPRVNGGAACSRARWRRSRSTRRTAGWSTTSATTSRPRTGRATGRSSSSTAAGSSTRCRSAGGTPRKIDTGFATRCNNDHGLSPDGTLLAITDQSQGDGQSLIYVLPAAGGTPAARHAARAVLLARLVAGREDAGLLRRARRRVRRLHDPGRGRGGDAADHGPGARRRPGLLARRPVDLLQLRADRDHADLADADGRHRGSSS